MMQTLTIKRYNELTDDQWRRVAATAKRQVRKITGHTSEIGIGTKYTGEQPLGRQIAVRVYLPQKRRRVAKQNRVPTYLLIKLKRSDGKFDLLKLQSDIESLGDYVPTSSTTKLGRREAATGFLLRWIGVGGNTEWGFATVGHLFDGTSLRVASVRVNSTTTFKCRRYKAPAKSKHLDLAVTRIVGSQSNIEEKLKRCHLIETANPPSIHLMTARQVHKAVMAQKRGRTFPPDGDDAFTGEEVFPNGFLLGSRILDDCIRVGRTPPETFRQGTSGTCWRFGTEAACMQVGGKATDFQEGIGQPFDSFMSWIRSAIGESVKVVANW